MVFLVEHLSLIGGLGFQGGPTGEVAAQEHLDVRCVLAFKSDVGSGQMEPTIVKPPFSLD